VENFQPYVGQVDECVLSAEPRLDW
jgi:hypothetical protein